MVRHMHIIISHWVPLVTRCPINGMPDFLYAEIHYELGETPDFPELYSVRKVIRNSVIFGERIYMEELTKRLATILFESDLRIHKVVVRMPFNRHRVEIERDPS